MIEADRAAAIRILNDCIEQCARLIEGDSLAERDRAIRTLTHAIRWLAYPDRAVYPKTRKGTKKHPVVLR